MGLGDAAVFIVGETPPACPCGRAIPMPAFKTAYAEERPLQCSTCHRRFKAGVARACVGGRSHTILMLEEIR